MKQIELRKDDLFSKVNSSGLVLYITQIDKVYYFDRNNAKNSFYVELYRPEIGQKEFSDCISANIPKLIKIDSTLKICRVNYSL